MFQRFFQRVRPVFLMARSVGGWIGIEMVLVFFVFSPVWGIVPHPSQSQILEAVEKGKEAAKSRTPPNRLYWHFGASRKDVHQAHGFLMTKLNGIAVLSSHFALRGEQPTSQDIYRVLDEEALQVVVVIFGDSPTFARDSYLLLKQGDRVIKPDRIRYDARASPIGRGRGPFVFRAKIVASFNYGGFDAEARTIIHVFPGSGGKRTFDLDFGSIP